MPHHHDVRVALFGDLRFVSAKRVLLPVAAGLVLAVVLGGVGELAAQRGEQLATEYHAFSAAMPNVASWKHQDFDSSAT